MNKVIIIGIVILVAVVAGLLIWSNYIPKTIGSTCDVSKCGPAMDRPIILCPDGINYSGPTGRCLLTAEKTCGWEVTSCPTTQIANPASTYCINNGGTLSIIDTSAGQIGICNFANGTACEEWAFMRELCKDGVYEKTIPEKICTMDCPGVCGVDGKTYCNECVADNVPIAYDGICN
ncbi:MAG: DUF333 domain-containing protein [archaeon]